MALPFARSADFAIDKPAGTPCRNLDGGFGCTIHDRLNEAGFPGCTAYDCFGAGQRIAQDTFDGRDWRTHPALAAAMFAAFATMRQLHELLWYLDAALGWPAAGPVHDELRRVREQIEDATRGDSAALAELDVTHLRAASSPWLRRASALVRPTDAADHSGADFTGADLRAAPLTGASLRNARLLGADLRGCRLRTADLLGADLRRADVRSADLTHTLFLTQPQVSAARGDAGTRIPLSLRRPLHWTS